ncbi:unnamed protein product [Adineta ricciae]|uniref:Uncharacterized protein n=1 Tax=Adineta ricciae TaxID=249248 RepID=A0A814XWU6_ADIRI|nr:unnamed protein product [Adineta ricciae]CAF1421187.1 unnamed protein product [Adineta ricciae]
MFYPNSNQQQSFPELVGRSAQEAVAYISSRGLKPVVVQANQPVTMDFSTNRVRIVVDPTGRTVIQTPNVG